MAAIKKFRRIKRKGKVVTVSKMLDRTNSYASLVSQTGFGLPGRVCSESLVVSGGNRELNDGFHFENSDITRNNRK